MVGEVVESGLRRGSPVGRLEKRHPHRVLADRFKVGVQRTCRGKVGEAFVAYEVELAREQTGYGEFRLGLGEIDPKSGMRHSEPDQYLGYAGQRRRLDGRQPN